MPRDDCYQALVSKKRPPADSAAPPALAYPLRTVAARTGLTPDLVRAWEKRYGVVAPVRGPRGARLYSGDDIHHLSLIARAVNEGLAIGDVARLDRATLEHLFAVNPPPANARPAAGDNEEIRAIVAALVVLDGQEVRRLLGQSLVAHGVTEFVWSLVVPLLVEVGDQWRRGDLSVAAEHLCSAVVKDMVGALGYVRHSQSRPTLVLAAMSGERHDIGLTLVDLMAGLRGLPTLRLGADLPTEDVLAAVRATQPRVLGISAVASDNRDATRAAIAALLEQLPTGTDLWLGGADAEAIARALRSPRVSVVQDQHTLEQRLDQLARTGEPPRVTPPVRL